MRDGLGGVGGDGGWCRGQVGVVDVERVGKRGAYRCPSQVDT